MINYIFIANSAIPTLKGVLNPRMTSNTGKHKFIYGATMCFEVSHLHNEMCKDAKLVKMFIACFIFTLGNP